MNVAMLALLFHVIVAVLGVGLVGALPIAARKARHAGLGLSALAVYVPPLALTVRLSLFLAFSSGDLLYFAAHGEFLEAWWFRLSVLLVVVTALCLARANAALTRGLSGEFDAPAVLRRIERWGFTSAIAVACIVVLMEWKPF